MMSIAIKICGITTREDGLAALQAGANLLGFNFYPPSPRYLTTDSCARLVRTLRTSGYHFRAVGVFVNHSIHEIETLLESCGLDLAQLSGDESPDTLKAFGDRAFKALRPVDADSLARDLDRYPPRPEEPAYLVDAFRPGQFGGTGQTADWGLAYDLARQYPILLAGGLTPDNVDAAIHQVHPWGVDVASGVEASPGRKDPAKMVAFIQASQHASDPTAFEAINLKENTYDKHSID